MVESIGKKYCQTFFKPSHAGKGTPFYFLEKLTLAIVPCCIVARFRLIFSIVYRTQKASKQEKK